MTDIARGSAASTPRTIYLNNYRAPDYLIDNVELHFELDPVQTRVTSRLNIRVSPDAPEDNRQLVLNGQDLTLTGIRLNGQLLSATDYTLDEDSLLLENIDDDALLEIETLITPGKNTALEGLYVSSDMFCTQCEAEGFRRITYFPDRPDIMARYTTTLVADKARYPVLLSNGNPVNQGELEDGRHWVSWHDPFLKPSYLFALVAGNLHCQEDSFTTQSGREITLKIYVEPENSRKCDHALHSLKQAMRWDEETYGREYDLDIFMIVAVNDFNMGAMENKGLNIFNSSCILASPETATDADYYNIQSIIGHEYFHNWSGNRVTCRDWFQLSLKEGFTVFRDQEFSADLNSRPVKRIADVNVLRSHQFAQDASPMAHPVRPDSYIEISNFYTVTVYNKGAEVVRMICHLCGRDGFRKGCDLYFERHDGQAITTDDFVNAMEDANKLDLTQFRRWYSQAGTPVIQASTDYNAESQQFHLTLSQQCPPTPGQDTKLPFHIPVEVALLDTDGTAVMTRLTDTETAATTHHMLELKAPTQQFTFESLSQAPRVSLLRGFSAPVKIDIERSNEELAFLFANDPDPFNRWDAGQTLSLNILLALIDDIQRRRPLQLDDTFIHAFRATLNQENLDPALISQALMLPSEPYIADQCELVDVVAIHRAREFVRQQLATRLHAEFATVYDKHHTETAYRFDAPSMARRSLKNISLSYLLETGDEAEIERCLQQLETANNMTDSLAALAALAQHDLAQRQPQLDRFYAQWHHDPQVTDKWFALQAASPLPDALKKIKLLTTHPAFRLTNPNKVRALIGRFCTGNQIRFHSDDGSGYRFLGDQVIELDAINPQMAARLVSALSRWRRFDAKRQMLMQDELKRIANLGKISKDVFEIVSKSLD
ncbi:Membrane alanine aminopeptidase N [hydrothermal vent metagenome]|uniref:Membrane alanine aminopeptidase N n=1 Tax=hydrothermal vent metagenome TaxID=652676 RepID=A0A3B0ZPM6_9ZZZZ